MATAAVEGVVTAAQPADVVPAGQAAEAVPAAEQTLDVSVVMPCLNEEQTVGACVSKALAAFRRLGLRGEVIVCDNGSTDRSVEIATSLGARVIHERRKGYGSAYLRGIAEARAEFIIMGDSDDTYDFGDLEPFLKPLREGYDMVMGTRLAGKILPGAMTFSHRYIGNPILSLLLNLFYSAGLSDMLCGMRSFTRTAYSRLGLHMPGMEFASEMVVNAGRQKLKIAEVPITYYPRKGESKLETWKDGWRYLRFLLLYSPTHLFLLPGLSLLLPGLLLLLAELPGPFYVGGRGFYIHFMILGSMLTILGYEIITLGLYAKSYALYVGVLREDGLIGRLSRYYSLERGLWAGGMLATIGFAVDGWILLHWIGSQFGALDAIRPALFASTMIVLGMQTIFSSFFLSLLNIRPHARHGT